MLWNPHGECKNINMQAKEIGWLFFAIRLPRFKQKGNVSSSLLKFKSLKSLISLFARNKIYRMQNLNNFNIMILFTLVSTLFLFMWSFLLNCCLHHDETYSLVRCFKSFWYFVRREHFLWATVSLMHTRY